MEIQEIKKYIKSNCVLLRGTKRTQMLEKKKKGKIENDIDYRYQGTFEVFVVKTVCIVIRILYTKTNGREISSRNEPTQITSAYI